jgi:hypothetical protein
MPKCNAFWISPQGEIFEVKQTHINYIFDNPEKFGLELDYIKSVYDNHNEKYRFEGKARNEIIYDILQKEWVRLRYRFKNNIWTINYSGILDIKIDVIQNWITEYDILADKPSFKFIHTNGEPRLVFFGDITRFLTDKIYYNSRIYHCMNCEFFHKAFMIGVFCTNENMIEKHKDKLIKNRNAIWCPGVICENFRLRTCMS